MSKYDALGKFLAEQKNSIIPMTFAEVERVVGHSLPSSAQYPAWWSNNSWNNVMTKIWLDAGFKTEQVDIGSRKLVFRRVSQPEPSASVQSKGVRSASSEKSFAETARPFMATAQRHPLFGALKGSIRIIAGTDITKPADAEWGEDKP